MCVTRALTIKRGRQFLMIITGVAALTGCGYFADNWEATGNKCQSLSSEENATATISRQGLVFLRLEAGCPANLDMLGSRFTHMDINGSRYLTTLVCNDATQNRMIAVVGIPEGIPAGGRENAASVLSAQAMKAFTGFMGAKVTIEGQSFHFSKGNFTQACRAFLPHGTAQHATVAPKAADNKPSLTLDDLNQQYKASHPPEGVTSKPTTRPEYAPDVAPTVPEPVALTADIYAQALARAKSTWLMSHPKGKADEQVWVRIRQPDKTLNDEVVRVIRYTTTQPDTGVISDVDVEISPDGSVGYALSKDRVSPTPSVSSTPSTPVQVPPPSTVTNPINAFCTLDNGKHVSVYAAGGQDYRYRYTDKNDKTELELKEGLFGVKAFHYYAQLGMGSARYIRFNKGVYDYVLLSKDTGHVEFYGVQVYKNGDLISSHECTTPLNLDTASLSSDSHLDSEKMGEYFTTH